MRLRSTRLRHVAGAVALAAALAACSDGAAGTGGTAAAAGASAAAAPSGSAAPKGPTVTRLGVTVTGGFGQAPALSVPGGAAAPAEAAVEVLSAGKGRVVRAGDLVVTGYHVQSWGSGGAPSATLDDTWARGLPRLGIAGPTSADAWAKVVVGRRAGSRLLVVAPSADGWAPGAAGAKGPVAVVLDVVDVVEPGGAGAGTAVRGGAGGGYPTVVGAPGKAPTVTSVVAVGTSKKRRSRLLVEGTGDPVDAKRTLVVQLLEVDGETGRTVNSTWGGSPVLMPGRAVLKTVPALKAAGVGSRAVAVLPATSTTHARVLVLDVLDQV
ncbi:hypothetical protein [Kineosporia sp. R_H_3]|uniref:hypothetical protein n=1 Tax=Kineosporia sp. R_H_3 TaxID=1961848 RepID=UPI000B4A637F|nr:hypothetical protein [Kineosporia sp. R_H_3]